MVSAPHTLQHAAAGPGLRGGEVVGGINIGSAAKIGALLYTAVSNDGFAFTASAKYDGSAARGRSFLTVTDFRGAAPKASFMTCCMFRVCHHCSLFTG